MSNVNIEILFQTKSINIDLNKDGNKKEIFNKFIEQLKKEINYNTDKNSIFKLMTLNTKEMYLIVNEENFLEVMNEKTKDKKIKLFLDIGDEKEDNSIEPLGEGMMSGLNMKNDDVDDDFNDKLSLSGSNEIKITEEKKLENKINNDEENNIINIDNIISKKNNNIDNANNENRINNIENNDKDIINIKQTEFVTPLSNKLDKDEEPDKIPIKKDDNKDNNIIKGNISDNNNINNINNFVNKKNDINSSGNIINENNINNMNNNINNINNINNNENQIDDSIQIVEICTICNKLIKDKIKYECSICDQCILCQKCEEKHNHPCIKFKIGKSILSSLKDCHSFMTQKHKFTSILPIKYFKNIFNYTYDIILQLEVDNHIEIRPNKTIEIPILIKNYSDQSVSSKDFVILIKNYSNVNITYDMNNNFMIEPKNYFKINLNCVSGDKTGRDLINIEIYSTTIKIRDSIFSKINIELLVSKDEEDEELNKKFIFYPKIQLLNKLRKKMLLYIVEKHFCEKSITQIYDSLRENNWNLDTTINKLNNEI